MKAEIVCREVSQTKTNMLQITTLY